MSQGGRETKREIGIRVGLVLCQARSRGDGCVSVSVHHSVLHWHISITVGWADMNFCATALRREMRLLAAERFPRTTYANQKKKKQQALYLFPHFSFSHKSPEEQLHMICHLKNPLNLTLCWQPYFQHSFSFLLKLLPCWTSHVFWQEKTLCLRGRKQHGEGVVTTFGGVPVFCALWKGFVLRIKVFGHKLSEKRTKSEESKDGLLLFMRRFGKGHRHVILSFAQNETCHSQFHRRWPKRHLKLYKVTMIPNGSTLKCFPFLLEAD